MTVNLTCCCNASSLSFGSPYVACLAFDISSPKMGIQYFELVYSFSCTDILDGETGKVLVNHQYYYFKVFLHLSILSVCLSVCLRFNYTVQIHYKYITSDQVNEQEVKTQF